MPVEGGGSGVSSLNSLTGAITLIAGSNITITPSGSNITIASSGGGTPGGTSGQIQYNNGAFGGFGNTDGTNFYLTLGGVFQDYTGVTSVDANVRQLINATGYLSVDWQAHQLFDAGVNYSIDWQARQLYSQYAASLMVDYSNNYNPSAFLSFGLNIFRQVSMALQGPIMDNSSYSTPSIDTNAHQLFGLAASSIPVDYSQAGQNSGATLSFDNSFNAFFSGAITVAGTIQATVSSENYTLSPGWGSTVTGTTTATIDFNAQNASCVQLSLTASDHCVLTISNVVPGGAYVIKVLNASGATVGWPSSFDWGAAGAPTLSASGLYDDVHLLVQQSTSNIHAYVSKGFSS